MLKQYATRQRFVFEKYNKYHGTWEKAGYLLMPKEIDEFHHYLNDLEWSYDQAFERITNKTIKDDTGNVCYRDIVLLVETIKIVKQYLI